MTALFSWAPLISESPFVAHGGCPALLFLGSGIPPARQAGPTAMGVADRGREQQDSELGSRWLGQLEALLLGSMGLTGWSWKNDKCRLRASSEWPDHRPQYWTRAALLCLGLGPELSTASLRLGAGPQRSRRRLTGQPALGKEYLGPGRALLAKKTPGLSDKACGSPSVALNFKAGCVREQRKRQSRGQLGAHPSSAPSWC